MTVSSPRSGLHGAGPVRGHRALSGQSVRQLRRSTIATSIRTTWLTSHEKSLLAAPFTIRWPYATIRPCPAAVLDPSGRDWIPMMCHPRSHWGISCWLTSLRMIES